MIFGLGISFINVEGSMPEENDDQSKSEVIPNGDVGVEHEFGSRPRQTSEVSVSRAGNGEFFGNNCSFFTPVRAPVGYA